MLIEQIDDIGLQALERGFGDRLNVLRPAVQAPLLARLRIEIEAEFGGDDHMVAKGGQSLADELLVHEWAIDFGGIEEGDAALDGQSDQFDRPLCLRCQAIAKAQAHAAQAKGRDFKIVVSKFALLHKSRCEAGDLAASAQPRHPRTGRKARPAPAEIVSPQGRIRPQS